jgi:crotonobetainyl-CoA:carnitine CoA-transferase CaiB-like acyl-CoA transferase
VAAHAILAALFKRERTGEGSYVEVPMLESMVAFNLVEHFYGLHFEPPLAPPGYPRLLNPFRKPFRTLDGYLCAMPYTDAHWKRFFIEAGEPALAEDTRFTNIALRTQNISALYEIAERILATRTTGQWLDVCARLEIPASRMNRLEDLQDDPHLKANGFFETIDDPAMGPVRFPGVPVKLDGERLPVTMPPRLGQHTHEVLAEVGLGPLAHAATNPAAAATSAAL